MNVLYLHTHDTGRYIQPYGVGIQTPNLMRLAREGTVFRQAYNVGPTCSPSRSGLLTGWMPHNNGMWGLAHRGFSLFDPSQHLASFLARHGMETVLCGIQHEAVDPKSLGYTKILEYPAPSKSWGSRTGRDYDLGNAKAAAAYIQSRPEKPFFLSLGLFNTHREFPPLDPDAEPQYVQVPPQIADTPENRRDMAAFCQSVRIVDEAMGLVLDALRESGLEDETLVFFTTDHGPAFPEMKCTLYDTGIGVSLILRVPGNKRIGTAVDALTSHLDLCPTICEFLGIQAPSWLQGFSLMPLLRGETEQVRTEIFSEVTYHAAHEPMRCIRTERYKYIRRFGGYKKRVPPNVDDSPSKALLMEQGYYAQEQPRGQLFDLVLDPLERLNLLDAPGYADVREALRKRLDQWMEETDDPLRKGPMLPPSGAIINRSDSPSPKDKDFVLDFRTLG